eukprot:3446113-Alexandrium_andersonii.AAC.1
MSPCPGFKFGSCVIFKSFPSPRICVPNTVNGFNHNLPNKWSRIASSEVGEMSRHMLSTDSLGACGSAPSGRRGGGGGAGGGGVLALAVP